MSSRHGPSTNQILNAALLGVQTNLVPVHKLGIVPLVPLNNTAPPSTWKLVCGSSVPTHTFAPDVESTALGIPIVCLVYTLWS